MFNNDIWQTVPRTILKNEKRCRGYLEASRARSESQVSSSMSSQPPAQLTPINATQQIETFGQRSSILCDERG